MRLKSKECRKAIHGGMHNNISRATKHARSFCDTCLAIQMPAVSTDITGLKRGNPHYQAFDIFSKEPFALLPIFAVQHSGTDNPRRALQRVYRSGFCRPLKRAFGWHCPFLIAIIMASPALGEERRELCPDRPGLGTPPCTVAAGEVVGELGVASWTRENTPQTQANTIVAGEALLRVGLTGSLEGQIGWTAFSHLRQRDRMDRALTKTSETGDVSLALRQNLANPDGSGFSVAMMSYVTLPVGGSAAGGRDWGAGFLLPISFDLGQGLSVGLTPQLDAVVDADGDGRHLGFGSVAGIGFELGPDLSTTVEFSPYRDQDPDGNGTQAVVGLSAGWQPADAMQIDIGLNIGVNEASPDSEIYFGIARRF